jgi:hypothetical protein
VIVQESAHVIRGQQLDLLHGRDHRLGDINDGLGRLNSLAECIAQRGGVRVHGPGHLRQFKPLLRGLGAFLAIVSFLKQCQDTRVGIAAQF